MNACHILFLTFLPFLATNCRAKPMPVEQEKKAQPPYEAAASQLKTPPTRTNSEPSESNTPPERPSR